MNLGVYGGSGTRAGGCNPLNYTQILPNVVLRVWTKWADKLNGTLPDSFLFLFFNFYLLLQTVVLLFSNFFFVNLRRIFHVLLFSAVSGPKQCCKKIPSPSSSSSSTTFLFIFSAVPNPSNLFRTLYFIPPFYWPGPAPLSASAFLCNFFIQPLYFYFLYFTSCF